MSCTTPERKIPQTSSPITPKNKEIIHENNSRTHNLTSFAILPSPSNTASSSTSSLNQFESNCNLKKNDPALYSSPSPDKARELAKDRVFKVVIWNIHTIIIIFLFGDLLLVYYFFFF